MKSKSKRIQNDMQFNKNKHIVSKIVRRCVWEGVSSSSAGKCTIAQTKLSFQIKKGGKRKVEFRCSRTLNVTINGKLQRVTKSKQIINIVFEKLWKNKLKYY